MRIPIFILLLIYIIQFDRISSAKENQITFTLERPLLDESNFLQIKVRSEQVDISKYKLKPVLEEGKTSIYSPQTGVWVSTNESWKNIPYMNEEVQIKANGSWNSQEVNLILIVQDISSGKIIQTDQIPIKTAFESNDYIQKINKFVKTITDMRNTHEEVNTVSLPTERPSNEKTGGSGLFLYYISLFSFSTFTGLKFNRQR
jgi:hypothetical protein